MESLGNFFQKKIRAPGGIFILIHYEIAPFSEDRFFFAKAGPDFGRIVKYPRIFGGP